MALTSHNAFGQAMLNVKKYSNLFITRGSIENKYLDVATDNDFDRIAVIGGENDEIDTPLEIAILSTCAGVIDIRPAGADAIIPKNNPKLADQKLGAAVFQEIQILRFLGDTAAVSRHEAMLKWITDRKNATRQEIEAFYRDNVRALIAEVVDEEFNKINFLIENRSSTHTAVLTRNPQNGQYTLSYGGTYTNEEIREITKPTLNALLDEMGRREKDFDKIGIEAVKAQAALIPAVHIPTSELNAIKQSMTQFFTDATKKNFDDLLEKYNRNFLTNGDRGRAIARALYNTAYSFNPALGDMLLK